MSHSTIVVRETSVDEVQPLAQELLNATRRFDVGLDRFTWLYRDNPDGSAAAWTVGEGTTICGYTVALPRRIIVSGVERLAWNGADFSILPRYRTLGVAAKLRRAATEGIDAGRADLLYAHPNEKMALIHARVGHQPVGTMVRYALAIQLEPHLRKILPRPIAAVAARPAEIAVRVAGRAMRHRMRSTLEFHDSMRFDARFDALFESSRTQMPVIGVRDSRYLNWRYADNPLYQTEIITAERQGTLVGYLLFTRDDDVAHIKDLFPPADGSAMDDLVCGLVREARRRRLKSISFALLDTNPLIPHLRSFGFRRRLETSQMFIYAPGGSPLRDVVLDGKNWFITVGDRDV